MGVLLKTNTMPTKNKEFPKKNVGGLTNEDNMLHKNNEFPMGKYGSAVE